MISVRLFVNGRQYICRFKFLSMRKLRLILLFLLPVSMAIGQQTKNVKDTLPRRDTIMEELKSQMLESLPTISLEDDDLSNSGGSGISSVLTAGRDPFYSAASFNWSSARFRVRGYDNDAHGVYMNGIPMENLDNGFTPYGLWGGLNDVMRNKELSLGLRPATFTFGDIGSSTNIDARSIRQRKQTSIGYALSNRNYSHRVHFTHSSGMTKDGWAYTISGSRRWANEGYVPGTYYDGLSYFAAVDKKLGSKNMLSLTVFGAPTENARQTGSTLEAMDLAGTHYYNPAWGYQNGKQRSANVAKSHQPYIILTHDLKLNNNTTLVSAVGYSFGERATSALDWYNAADPRPDYYRYLPSYQQDPYHADAVKTMYQQNPDLLQIQWDQLYQANKSVISTVQNANGIAGNNVTGYRSRYILQDRVIGTDRFNYNSTLNTRFGDHLDFSAGLSYQYQKNHYFNRVKDLLGGEFYVDINQFAERDFAYDPDVVQNDLNNPNRILKLRDHYGHDYNITIHRGSAWAQAAFKYNKVDYFIAGQVSQTRFWRTGNVRNGLFPNNSYGKSDVNTFTNFGVKGGITYKFDGRNYVFANAAYTTKAPFFDNVYIAPRTRDFIQADTKSETIISGEGGFIHNSPTLRYRISGYYTMFNDGMDVMSFYHDEVRNFVNYALSGIDKVHFGGEFGVEAKLAGGLTANAAASIGRYFYSSRQNAIVTVDNNSSVLDITRANQTIFSENFYIPSTPQEAYSLGLTYRSPKYWFISLTGNYFDKMWLSFNPIRRTVSAVDGIDRKTTDGEQLYREIIDQTQFDPQFTLDFFGGWSYKLQNRKYHMGNNAFLVFNVGVNNILDNKDIVSGGYEQLRFDFAGRKVNKFPPKLYYAYGLNYFASVTLRF